MRKGPLPGPSLTGKVSLGCCQAVLVWTSPFGYSGTCRSTALLAHMEATRQELLQ